ncbi:MAG: SixA phosphatase family protein [Terrimicrobiaceae bacterium]
MRIGFLRHAEAEDANGSDFERQLTHKGHEQAAKVGKFCQHHNLVPDLIITSPVVRARQTAGIVAKVLGCDLIEERWLACGMDPEDCLKEIAAFFKKDFVLLVGHEPDFSDAIATIIGLPDPSALKIGKASLTVLELVEPRPGCGQLQFLIPPRLM